MEPTIPVRPMWAPSSSHTTKSRPILKKNKQTRNCNCRKKEKCPMETNCRSGNIIYRCVVIATGHPRKVYLGTAEDDFKQ